MIAITVFSTAASFLSFTSVRETSSVPRLEDFAWDADVAITPFGTIKDSEHGYVPHIGDKDKYAYEPIVANYLILGVENERFRAAYVAFPGRSNFDKVTKGFLEYYGEANNLGLAPDNHYWFGDNLNILLRYQADTDEGILALTYQEA